MVFTLKKGDNNWSDRNSILLIWYFVIKTAEFCLKMFLFQKERVLWKFQHISKYIEWLKMTHLRFTDYDDGMRIAKKQRILPTSCLRFVKWWSSCVLIKTIFSSKCETPENVKLTGGIWILWICSQIWSHACFALKKRVFVFISVNIEVLFDVKKNCIDSHGWHLFLFSFEEEEIFYLVFVFLGFFDHSKNRNVFD